MGLSDKFKNLAKQAQDAVAANADKLHEAVDTVGVAVNEKTQGKYATKIAKVGEKTSSAIDKIGGTEAADTPPGDDASADAGAQTETTGSAEPTASETPGAEASSPSPEATASSPGPPPAADGFPSFDE
jgi:hypothetical protein